MMNKKSLISVIGLLFLCLIIVAPITEGYNVRVMVIDETTAPIENATVNLAGQSVKTSSAGYVDFDINSGDYDIKVSKSGYDTKTIEATVQNETAYAVTLSESTSFFTGFFSNLSNILVLVFIGVFVLIGIILFSVYILGRKSPKVLGVFIIMVVMSLCLLPLTENVTSQTPEDRGLTDNIAFNVPSFVTRGLDDIGMKFSNDIIIRVGATESYKDRYVQGFTTQGEKIDYSKWAITLQFDNTEKDNNDNWDYETISESEYETNIVQPSQELVANKNGAWTEETRDVQTKASIGSAFSKIGALTSPITGWSPGQHIAESETWVVPTFVSFKVTVKGITGREIASEVVYIPFIVPCNAPGIDGVRETRIPFNIFAPFSWLPGHFINVEVFGSYCEAEGWVKYKETFRLNWNGEYVDWDFPVINWLADGIKWLVSEAKSYLTGLNTNYNNPYVSEIGMEVSKPEVLNQDSFVPFGNKYRVV